MTGKGSFVSGANLELIREENLKRIGQHMLQITELACGLNLSLKELQEMLSVFYKGES